MDARTIASIVFLLAITVAFLVKGPRFTVGPSDPDARRKPSYRILLGAAGTLVFLFVAWAGQGTPAYPQIGIAGAALTVLLTIAWLIFRW
jgi:hypothetical protein